MERDIAYEEDAVEAAWDQLSWDAAAVQLLKDIEADLLPSWHDNWLSSSWKHDLFPRVRRLLAEVGASHFRNEAPVPPPETTNTVK